MRFFFFKNARITTVLFDLMISGNFPHLRTCTHQWTNKKIERGENKLPYNVLLFSQHLMMAACMCVCVCVYLMILIMTLTMIMIIVIICDDANFILWLYFVFSFLFSEHVWEVQVHRRGLAVEKNIVGTYHLCLTDKALRLSQTGSKTTQNGEQRMPYVEFLLTTIRR